jgi:hypothetical protein
MYLKYLLLITLAFTAAFVNGQTTNITILDSAKQTGIRGLSVVDDNVVWCSGTRGQVAKSTDGGKTFTWTTVAGYEKRDFRDIEAFDSNIAIIMAVSEPAVLLKTYDGGITWKKVFEDTTKGMFLDAMDFIDDKDGVVVGDPINGEIFFANTTDSGNTWKRTYMAKAEKGEAFFAASGSNIKLIRQGQKEKTEIMYVSGGLKSKLYSSKVANQMLLPIVQGKESAGANAIAVFGNKGIIVGGDFDNDTNSENNCVLFDMSKDIKFSHPQTTPHGYRSSVIYIDAKTLVACGTSGVDISYDGGLNWQLISKGSYHVVQKAKRGKSIYLAGSKGRIAKFSYTL